MPLIIGTAGHIDHGKTTLVKALTGEDTDRLKEEKERGISIDLGFAHFTLPDGTRVGVVDVPGHERFIRNMLAGAHGIDVVLFTVAADDGVMPQTEEHFDIVHLLGIDSAIFVITKIDLASEERIAEVEEQIEILTAGTVLEGSPVVRVSAVTGHGLDALTTLLVTTLQGRQAAARNGYFRLPVDRVFVLTGHGVVVTGTAQSGEVSVGDHVRCFPGDQRFRVRSLEVHNAQVSTATWGQRVAMNISGGDKASIERGHVICHERLTLPTARFDATLEVRPSASKGIKNHQGVRVHVGTAERLGRIVLLGSGEIARPKQRAYCQVVLTEPVLTLRGDRFVIRDETAQRTIGGGVVLHPWPRKHKRREAGLESKLETLRDGDSDAVVRLFIADRDEFGVPLAPVYQFLNARAEEAAALLAGTGGIRTLAVEGETVYTTDEKWRALEEKVTAALLEHHAAHPLAPGRDLEDLRDRVSTGVLPPRVFRAFVDQLVSSGAIVREGNLVRDRRHAVRFQDDQRRAADRVTELLRSAGLSAPDVKQLEQDVGMERGKLTEVLRVLERERTIVRVPGELYFLRETLDEVKRTLVAEFGGVANFTPAMFRDRFGTTRKYAIPILEYFDREGVTIRVGDARRVRKEKSDSRGESYAP